MGSSLGQLVDQLVAEPHVFGDGSAVAARHGRKYETQKCGQGPTLLFQQTRPHPRPER